MESQLNIARVLLSLSHTAVIRLSYMLMRAMRVKMRSGNVRSSSYGPRSCPPTQPIPMVQREDLEGPANSTLHLVEHQHHCQAEGGAARPGGRKTMDEKLWSELPLHVLERVVAFLPPTSFLQQRSVCKDWHQILSSAPFLDLHSKVSAERPWFLMFRTGLCNYLSAYNPSMDKWHKIPLSFLPAPVHCVAASGGLLVCRDNDGLQTLYICNPITRQWKRLPPMMKKRVVPVVGVVVHRPSSSYEVIVAGDDLLSDGFNVRDVTTEVYDSRTGSWQLAGAIPDSADLDLGCTWCKGSLYFITYCPYGVLSYNVEKRVWSRVVAPLPPSLSTPSLVECQGTLYMVGGLEKSDHTVHSIRIWELRETPARWEEGVRMPNKVWKEFFKKSCDRYFSSVGNGHLICMTIFESSDVLAYDVKAGSWRWLPSHRSENEDFQEKHLWGLTFEPRLDLCM